MAKARRTVRVDSWAETIPDPVALSIIIDFKTGEVLYVHRIFADGLDERCQIDAGHQFDPALHEEVKPLQPPLPQPQIAAHKDLIYHKKIGAPKGKGNCIRWVGSYCVLRDTKGCDGCS